jgi:hypothetical protein
MTYDRPGRLPRYTGQWIATWTLLGVGFALFLVLQWMSKSPVADALPDPAEHPYVDWYQIVRFPELPGANANPNALKKRLVEWVSALRREGFVVRPWMEVLDRLERGVGVPRQTLVIVFEPGYKRTITALAPLLERTGIPAAWLTHDPGPYGTERRYLSNHHRCELAKDGFWTTGLILDDMRVRLERRDADAREDIVVAWREAKGDCGVNHGAGVLELRRLHADPHWSAEEFVSRLYADVPLREEALLSVRWIRQRRWGVIPPTGEERAFDLEAPPDLRFASISWQGTQGIPGLEVHLDVDSWYGELWLFFRSDRGRESRIRIGFLDHLVRIEEEIEGDTIRHAARQTSVRSSDGLQATIVVEEAEVRVSGPSLPTVSVSNLQIDSSDDAVLELLIFDPVRGAACARTIRITATPLVGVADLTRG